MNDENSLVVTFEEDLRRPGEAIAWHGRVPLKPDKYSGFAPQPEEIWEVKIVGAGKAGIPKYVKGLRRLNDPEAERRRAKEARRAEEERQARRKAKLVELGRNEEFIASLVGKRKFEYEGELFGLHTKTERFVRDGRLISRTTYLYPDGPEVWHEEKEIECDQIALDFVNGSPVKRMLHQGNVVYSANVTLVRIVSVEAVSPNMAKITVLDSDGMTPSITYTNPWAAVGRFGDLASEVAEALRPMLERGKELIKEYVPAYSDYVDHIVIHYAAQGEERWTHRSNLNLLDDWRVQLAEERLREYEHILVPPESITNVRGKLLEVEELEPRPERIKAKIRPTEQNGNEYLLVASIPRRGTLKRYRANAEAQPVELVEEVPLEKEEELKIGWKKTPFEGNVEVRIDFKGRVFWDPPKSIEQNVETMIRLGTRMTGFKCNTGEVVAVSWNNDGFYELAILANDFSIVTPDQTTKRMRMLPVNPTPADIRNKLNIITKETGVRFVTSDAPFWCLAKEHFGG